MQGTLHLKASDEPTARLLTDQAQVEHLFMGSGVDGCYVEVTNELKASLRLIVREWDDAEDAAHRDEDGNWVDKIIDNEPIITHVGAAGSVVTTRGYNREAELLDPPEIR